jgi:hypothetical protein
MKLFAFCLSVIFLALFFVTSFVLMMLMTEIDTLMLTLNVILVLGACLVGMAFFKKMVKNYDRTKIMRTNFIASLVFCLIFVIYFFLTLSKIIDFEPIVFSVFMFMLGLLSGGTTVFISKLFIQELQVKSPYNLCTILYMCCIALAIVISSLFMQIYFDVQGGILKDTVILVYLIICIVLLILAAVIFLYGDKKIDDDNKKHSEAQSST